MVNSTVSVIETRAYVQDDPLLLDNLSGPLAADHDNMIVLSSKVGKQSWLTFYIPHHN